MPNADMITLQVPPEDLRPMIDPESYDPVSAGQFSSVTRKRKLPPPAQRKGDSDGSGDEDEGGSSSSDKITISRFIHSHKQ